MTASYGAWDGGRDPLEAPFDVRAAMDEIGNDVLSGASPRSALERLLRKGLRAGRGLDSIRSQARRRSRDLRKNNRLDGTLEQVKELLDQALTAEKNGAVPGPVRRRAHGRSRTRRAAEGHRPGRPRSERLPMAIA